MSNGSTIATIGAVGRGAVLDGPGLRTTVFFKGCPLRCPWCHNPELMSPRLEVSFEANRCIGCGDCTAACRQGAADHRSATRLDRSRCLGCGACASACPSRALKLVGRRQGVQETVAQVLADRAYHEVSGGGATLSGGEPTLQAPFAAALLGQLKAQKVHTALETCGACAPADLESLLPLLDLVLFDVKIADHEAHRRVVGGDSHVIWANLSSLLAARRDDTVVRIPVIPGYTDAESNLAALARRLEPLKPRRVALLPWNSLGLAKAATVGRVPGRGLPPRSMPRDQLERWRPLFAFAETVEP